MRQTVDVSTFTWGDFTTIFQEKYFPASVQEDLELEFLALVQGDMTIREYDARFSQLYRYVRPMGATALAQKYLRGLKQEYKTMISVLCLTSREQIFESAMSLEQAEKTRAGDVGNRDAKGKGKAVYTGSEHSGPKDRSWKRPRPHYQAPTRAPPLAIRAAPFRPLAAVRCYGCNEMGHYASACPKPKRGGCHRCGQVGHIARDCTRPLPGRQERPQRQLPAGQARVFAVGQRDTGVEGTLSLFDYLARVLFDTGASHSFIASSVVEMLGFIHTPL